MLYEQPTQATYRYREFRIELKKQPDAGPEGPYSYRAVGAEPDGFELVGIFVNPIDPSQVASALPSIPASSKAIQRSVPEESLDPVREMGARLFDALFDGSLGRAFVGATESANEKVRIRLVLDVAEGDDSVALPWEYLYNRARGDFLVLSTRSALVRNIATDKARQSGPLEAPIRILASVADVTGYWKVDEELGILRAAVDESDAATLDVVESATLEAFEDALERVSPHVVHVIGTGWEEGSPVSGRPRQQLAFMPDDPGDRDTASIAHFVDARRLRRLFGRDRDLRLVVLNGCTTDLLAADVARAAPATIGHRGAITDSAALAFTKGLYSSLLNGLPLEAAVTGGRLEIDANDPGGREWSAPVFYLQSADGTFLPTPAERDRTVTPVELVQAVAPPERADGDGADAKRQSLESLLKIQESNLAALSAQRDQFGGSPPGYLLEQIETANGQIERLRAEIAAVGASP